MVRALQFVRLTNVAGGHLTGFRWVLTLAGIAWGIRSLRARNLLKQPPTPQKEGSTTLVSKEVANISPLALRLLVQIKPIPYLLIDVRSDTEEALPTELAEYAYRIPEAEIATLLRPRYSSAWTEKFGENTPQPSIRTTLVFISKTGSRATRAAASAASLGYTRSAVVRGGLDAYIPAQDDEIHVQYINRDALAVLLERETYGCGEAPVVIDLRRHDERVLYGCIPDSLHMTADLFPIALDRDPDEWLRLYRFAKPTADDMIVLVSRTSNRSTWAAQLAVDAGYKRCYVYRQGLNEWCLDPSVKAYAAYQEGEQAPDPEPCRIEHVDHIAGELELRTLNLL